MATKRFYATRDLKNPNYGTRMLKAGDPVDLDGPKARLYLALGAVSPNKPKGAVKVEAAAPAVDETPATPKAAPKRKRKAKAKK